jgi:hypothetical protein
MKNLILFLTMYTFTFYAQAGTKPTVKIVIKTDVKGKGGATAGSNGVSLCPIDAVAVCATITTTIELGMAVQPGDIVPIGGSEGNVVFPDGSVKEIRILSPSHANIGDDGDVNIQGAYLLVEYLE